MNILKASVNLLSNGNCRCNSGKSVHLARNYTQNIQSFGLGASLRVLSNFCRRDVRLNHPKDWNKVSLKNKHRLPSVSGIYAVMSGDSPYVYYIGLSEDINARWGSHHRYPQAQRLRAPFIAYKQFPVDKIGEIEKQYISRLKPKWNGTRVPHIKRQFKNNSELPVKIILIIFAFVLVAAVTYIYPWILCLGLAYLLLR